MQNQQSFPLGLVILLAAILLAGALRFQRARAQRPAQVQVKTERAVTPCQTDSPTVAVARHIEEPRRLPEIAASPLGMPIDLSALQGRPAAGPRNRSREAYGGNIREECAALYRLEVEVERLASPHGRLPRQAFDNLDGALVPAPARPTWSLAGDLPYPVMGRPKHTSGTVPIFPQGKWDCPPRRKRGQAFTLHCGLSPIERGQESVK